MSSRSITLELRCPSSTREVSEAYVQSEQYHRNRCAALPVPRESYDGRFMSRFPRALRDKWCSTSKKRMGLGSPEQGRCPLPSYEMKNSGISTFAIVTQRFSANPLEEATFFLRETSDFSSIPEEIENTWEKSVPKNQQNCLGCDIR